MKKVRESELKPWIRKHKFAGRLFTIAFLLVLPICVAVLILWAERSQFVDAFVEVGRAAFLPWERDE